MKIERFKQMVQAFGAEPELWPAGERDAARQLIATSSEARSVVEQASRLDAVLSQSRVTEPSTALLDRIVTSATAQPQQSSVRSQTPRRWFSIEMGFGRLWHQAAGLAACALMGFVVGWSGVIDIPSSDAGELEISAMLADDVPFDGAGL